MPYITTRCNWISRSDRLADTVGLGVPGSATIRKAGGVGRFTWKGVEGKLKLGLESGFATGDLVCARVLAGLGAAWPAGPAACLVHFSFLTQMVTTTLPGAWPCSWYLTASAMSWNE